MKLKISKKFIDKITGETYLPGDIKEFEDARAEELLADQRNLVSKAPQTRKSMAKKSIVKKKSK